MTALGDALAAAQSRAVAALGKQYVAEQVSADELHIALDSIGLNDPADTAQWVAALDILRATGATMPRENGAKRDDDPATDAQWSLIRRLAEERKVTPPDEPLTKAEASQVIERLRTMK